MLLEVCSNSRGVGRGESSPPLEMLFLFVLALVSVSRGTRKTSRFFFRKCLEMMSGGRKCVDAPSVERLRKHVSIVSVDGKFHFVSFSIRVAEVFC